MHYAKQNWSGRERQISYDFIHTWNLRSPHLLISNGEVFQEMIIEELRTRYFCFCFCFLLTNICTKYFIFMQILRVIVCSSTPVALDNSLMDVYPKIMAPTGIYSLDSICTCPIPRRGQKPILKCILLNISNRGNNNYSVYLYPKTK